MKSGQVLQTLLYTVVALTAFAANSVLGRLALGERAIDAAGFTSVRLLAGAVTLWLLCRLKGPFQLRQNGSWFASLMLFVYAISFSFAYGSLDTGTGALILFGAVQISMIFLSIVQGARLHISEWVGVLVAFSGFVYLVLPGVSAPSISGFALMTIAGIAWGIYSILGKGSERPLFDTAANFIRTLPLAVLVLLFTLDASHYSQSGVALAVVSGSVTSGMGYAIWYVALGGLTATQAAVVQLSVPVIATMGGVIFVAEAISLRLTMASGLILGGILLVVLGKYYLARVTIDH